MEWTIEPMRDSDWPAVREIYGEGIETGDATFQTAAPEWPEWDGNHLCHSRLVARHQGSIGGWAALSPVSRRECYAGVAEAVSYTHLVQQIEAHAERKLHTAHMFAAVTAP